MFRRNSAMALSRPNMRIWLFLALISRTRSSSTFRQHGGAPLSASTAAWVGVWWYFAFTALTLSRFLVVLSRFSFLSDLDDILKRAKMPIDEAPEWRVELRKML